MKSTNYLFLTLIFVLLLISNIVSCRSMKKPRALEQMKDVDLDIDDLDKRYKPCLIDEDLYELCERCLRIAEVNGDDLFAMCCVNEDEAQDFCKNYVFYGIT